MKKGRESIESAVRKDCSQKSNCFNPDGCNVERYKYVPEDNPGLIEMGFKTKCLNVGCTHAYCDKFKWIMERAAHYADKLEMTLEDVLTAWENNRTYWYMNFYQDSKQPLITENSLRIFHTKNDLLKSVEVDKGFRCPNCNGVSKDAYSCTCDGCDWKAYGLFGTMGKGIDIFLKETMQHQHIFMPIAWEKEVAA